MPTFTVGTKISKPLGPTAKPRWYRLGQTFSQLRAFWRLKQELLTHQQLSQTTATEIIFAHLRDDDVVLAKMWPRLDAYVISTEKPFQAIYHTRDGTGNEEYCLIELNEGD